jgi:hypothetical protein
VMQHSRPSHQSQDGKNTEQETVRMHEHHENRRC